MPRMPSNSDIPCISDDGLKGLQLVPGPALLTSAGARLENVKVILPFRLTIRVSRVSLAYPSPRSRVPEGEADR